MCVSSVLCIAISADLSGRYWFSPSIRWQSSRCQFPALQYCLLLSTLVQFFGDRNHVTVFRQTPKSDGFFYFRHSCDRYSTLSALPPPTPILCGPTQRESVTRETKISGLCRHISNSQDQSRKRKKKGPQNKHPLFSLKQDAVCCCALGSDVIVMVHPLCDLWADDSSIASSGGAHQLERWFCFTVTPTHPPPLHKHKHACIHLISQK